MSGYLMQLLDEVRARFEQVFAGQYFEDPVNGASVPDVFVGDLPPKLSDPSANQDFPFFVLYPGQVNLTFSEDSLQIRGIAGLYTSGGSVDGILQVSKFIEVVKEGCRQRLFGDFQLLWPVQVSPGGKDGMQYHPQYTVETVMAFKKHIPC